MPANDVDPSQSTGSHFVDYDWENPAPVFTQEQKNYVNKVAAYLGPDELQRTRQIEWMVYNRNMNACGYEFVPGLRGDVNIRGEAEGFVYVKRFSSVGYRKMMDLFLDHVPEDFPTSGSGGNMPGYRVTLPSGDRFYPIAFFGDLAAWDRRLRESAELHQTQLAQFDRGEFAVSDGQRFRFGDITVELLESRRHPKSW